MKSHIPFQKPIQLNESKNSKRFVPREKTVLLAFGVTIYLPTQEKIFKNRPSLIYIPHNKTVAVAFVIYFFVLNIYFFQFNKANTICFSTAFLLLLLLKAIAQFKEDP